MITEINSDLCRKWLFLAVYALAVSGLLSITIIFLRFPSITNLFSDVERFFGISLVVHVNMSVLVWMCSVTLIILSFLIKNSKYLKYFKILYYASFLGTLMMIFSMFVSDTIAFKNNYIPVLNNIIFLTGLGVFLISFLFYALLVIRESNSSLSVLSLGIYNAAIMVVVVFTCFFLAYNNGYTNDSMIFYETLFWGGGHLLQFVFAQALILSYLIVLNIDENNTESIAYIKITLITNALLVVFVPTVYFFYDASSPFLINFFTWHMRIAGSFIPISIFIFVIFNIKRFLLKENVSLLCSILTFLYGGILGLLAVDGNVTIPAHYHGSIVGMTIAFMGFIYWLLPKLSLGEISNRLINYQICLYTIGQFLHITGLELLGGYGALRKVTYLPGSSSIIVKMLFIIGGIMAIIGGSIFAVIILNKIIRKFKLYMV